VTPLPTRLLNFRQRFLNKRINFSTERPSPTVSSAVIANLRGCHLVRTIRGGNCANIERGRGCSGNRARTMVLHKLSHARARQRLKQYHPRKSESRVSHHETFFPQWFVREKSVGQKSEKRENSGKFASRDPR